MHLTEDWDELCLLFKLFDRRRAARAKTWREV